MSALPASAWKSAVAALIVAHRALNDPIKPLANPLSAASPLVASSSAFCTSAEREAAARPAAMAATCSDSRAVSSFWKIVSNSWSARGNRLALIACWSASFLSAATAGASPSRLLT